MIILYQWTLQNVFPALVVQSVEDPGRLEPAFPGAAVIWVGTSPDSVAKIKESNFKNSDLYIRGRERARVRDLT